VIVGGGFGGIAAAKTLAGKPVTVTLVDRNNFHTFSPLLYQVATSALAPDDIAPNLRGIVRRSRNIEAHLGRVLDVDLDHHAVIVDNGPPIAYDYLILAAGSVSSDFGVPGVATHAIPLKSLEDATRLRSTVLRRFEEANANPALIDEGALRVVVAGGGPTGVELSGALAELFTKVLAKDFKNLDVSRAEVVLVEAVPAVLGSFSPASQREAVEELEARGVQLRLGTPIARVDGDGVELTDGTRVTARTVVWCAGVRANPIADSLGLARTRLGEIVVNKDLSVPGHPEVFVVGDLAAATDRAGRPYPQLAPVAMQGARHAARSIMRRVRGRGRTTRFRYFNKGVMATIGRRSAVAELPLGVHLAGTLGWLSWLGLHLVFLMGFRNRAVVFLNWAWNYFSWDRGNRIIIPDPD